MIRKRYTLASFYVDCFVNEVKCMRHPDKKTTTILPVNFDTVLFMFCKCYHKSPCHYSSRKPLNQTIANTGRKDADNLMNHAIQNMHIEGLQAQISIKKDKVT